MSNRAQRRQAMRNAKKQRAHIMNSIPYPGMPEDEAEKWHRAHSETYTETIRDMEQVIQNAAEANGLVIAIIFMRIRPEKEKVYALNPGIGDWYNACKLVLKLPGADSDLVNVEERSLPDAFMRAASSVNTVPPEGKDKMEKFVFEASDKFVEHGWAHKEPVK